MYDRPAMGTADLQLDHFQALVGETFVADFGDDGTLELELTEAVERPTGSHDGIAFALLFRGPTDPTFRQAMVPVTHDAVGAHHLFLVAVGESDAGREYEAVFTRLGG